MRRADLVRSARSLETCARLRLRENDWRRGSRRENARCRLRRELSPVARAKARSGSGPTLRGSLNSGLRGRSQRLYLAADVCWHPRGVIRRQHRYGVCQVGSESERELELTFTQQGLNHSERSW